ncbi:serine protease [Paenibacillaceae bacterium WGS1546]|uniref:S1 family peptidase n=1 Tax=Cohnella sp. WGS1546 TaxID=3366810 RepID=UPI00372D23D3
MDREKEAGSKPTSASDEEKRDDAASDEIFDPDAEDFWAEDEEEEAPPPRRKWIRNTILFLFAAALVGNILAFWPQIYNRETLPFLFKSRELSVREDVQSYKEAVVLISSDRSKGTGFHISNGYIVTNYHVIENNAYSIVQFPNDARGYEAELAAADAGLDIAILKVEIGSEALPYIEIESERPWEPGDPVYVIGNPLYFTQIVGEGKLLDLVPIRNREKPPVAIDAPVFKGHSGSPVINANGKVIAVVYATTELEREGERMQAGLAVPIADLADLLADLPLAGSPADG